MVIEMHFKYLQCSKGLAMPPQYVTHFQSSKENASRLATLCADEHAGWLCQSQGNEAPVVLVTGWTGLVRQLAVECIDFAAPPHALIKAKAWLTGNSGSWHFGQDGSASWRTILPDGAWAATLMTAGRTLAEAQKKFLI